MGLSVKIPGSCGELVQGMIDDIPFFSYLSYFNVYQGEYNKIIFPIYHIKLVLARNKTLDYLGH